MAAQPYRNDPGGKPVKNSTATLAMWLSLGGFISAGLSAIPGLVLGRKAKKEIDAQPERFTNGTQALLAVVIGWMWVGLWVVGILVRVFVDKKTLEAMQPPPPSPVSHVAAAVQVPIAAPQVQANALPVPTATTPPPATTAAPLDAKTFLTALAGFDKRYDAAPNDIKKSAIFNEAREWEKTYFKDSADVVDWRGIVRHIMTAKGGDSLSVVIRLGSASDSPDVEFEDGTGLFEKSIPKGSPVYLQAAELAEGGCVLFSGTIKSTKPTNVTETLSMSSPDYKIKFSALKPCH